METISKDKKAHFVDRVCGEINTFLEDVAAEFAPRLDAAEGNKHKLEKAEEASRYDARRIAALEREVAYLRSVNRYKDAETQTVLTPALSSPDYSRSPTKAPVNDKDISLPTVDIKEYSRIESELAKARRDLEDTSKAHLALTSKCRHYKERLKVWAEYCRKWHEMKGKRQNTSNREEATSEKATIARASSAPLQLTASDVSILPHARDYAPSLGLSTPGPSKGIPSHSPEPIITTVTGVDRVDLAHLSGSRELAQAASDDDPTQAPDDDHGEAGLENRQEPRLQDIEMLESRGNEESDTPVFVKVRPLKRKRERKDSSAGNVLKLARNEDAPGTASKPVHVKSDQSSSSPLAKIRFLGYDEIHDSMDLDEVGSKTKTPRKHQRYRMDERRSPTAAERVMSGSPSQHESFIGHDDAPEGHDENEGQETEEDPSQSSILDEASCRQKGEEFAARLWREQQARREQLEESQITKARARTQMSPDERSVQETCLQISEKNDGYSARVIDRQVEDFNQRMREAQHKEPEEPLPMTPRPIDLPVPSIRQHSETETRDFGLLTPITTARALPRQAPKQSRESKGHKYGDDHSVLQPKDANNQILPRTSELLAHEKAQCPPSRRDRGAAQIHTVLEDGEETPSSRKAKQGTTKSRGEQYNTNHTTKQAEVSAMAYHRLGTLLAEPSPGRQALPTEKLNVPQRIEQKKSRTPSRDITPGRKSPQLPRHRGSSSKATPTTSKAKKPTTYTKKPIPAALATLDLTSSDDPPSILPDDEPLRSRPVHRLRREDFKINPSANQGIGYAYREVVRKRRERQCLPNCDRPDCCGDAFKKLIDIAGPFPRQNRGLFESSPPDDECSKEGYDYNILKSYMGDNFHAWFRMSDEEKKEEWGRAQVWDLGHRFGRHKATGRQRTPPGFWKVDVDSTQEAQEQREEADKMAREEVVERWREAMRPRGIWKFADE